MENVTTKTDNEPKADRCKNLIAVLDETCNLKTIETVIRNIHTLGVEKIYIVDSRYMITPNLDEILSGKSFFKPSEPAIRRTFVKSFESTEECLEHLEKNGFTSIVISPPVKGKTNVILQEGDFTQKRLAVWFGNETRGISNLLVERAEAFVSVEMYGNFESLNPATSTAIVLYEIIKRRRGYQKKT